MAKGTRGSIWQVKGTDHKYKCISLLQSYVNSKTRIVADASPIGLGVVLIHL